MKTDFDKHRDVWGPMLTMQLNYWADYVLAPSAVLANNNQLKLAELGTPPVPMQFPDNENKFSKNGIELHMLSAKPGNYDSVKYFDYAAGEYEMATHKFKEHIVQQSFTLLEPFLQPNCTILDCACGTGYEAIALANKVPLGEVVAIDFSEQMIQMACRNAKEHDIKNMRFYQADVAAIPEELLGRFDIVHCQLSCSYFQNMHTVAGNLRSLLRQNGFVWLVEPNADLYNGLSIRATKAANPSFEQLYTKEDLRDIFLDAGFSDFYWKEILPGIGVSIIKKT